jgi:hypothetical protein
MDVARDPVPELCSEEEPELASCTENATEAVPDALSEDEPVEARLIDVGMSPAPA